MHKFSRRTKVTAGFIAIIAVVYGTAKILEAQNGVPASFSAARSQGAIIAQTIVNNSNKSTAALEQINQYDQQGNYTAALASTTELIQQSADLRAQAVLLSQLVSQMTQDLLKINNTDAQQAALESLSSRLAVINELVTYGSDLNHLLMVLQARFSGTYESNDQVQSIVNQINTDVNAINNFNAQAGQAMDKFDSIEKK